MTKIYVICALVIFSFTPLSFALEHSLEKNKETSKISDSATVMQTKVITGPRQYKPFNYQIDSINLIIYPVRDENPLEKIFSRDNKEEMLTHLKKLYVKNSKILSKGEYHILFVWNLDGHKMTDVWVHNMKNWSDSGPLIDCYTFKDLEITRDAGIASGDSIIVLGREEELRRKLGNNVNLTDYVNRMKYIPQFPKGLQPTESFFNP